MNNSNKNIEESKGPINGLKRKHIKIDRTLNILIRVC